jgi:uncharacterized protein (UPF0297 family)
MTEDSSGYSGTLELQQHGTNANDSLSTKLSISSKGNILINNATDDYSLNVNGSLNCGSLYVNGEQIRSSTIQTQTLTAVWNSTNNSAFAGVQVMNGYVITGSPIFATYFNPSGNVSLNESQQIANKLYCMYDNSVLDKAFGIIRFYNSSSTYYMNCVLDLTLHIQIYDRQFNFVFEYKKLISQNCSFATNADEVYQYAYDLSSTTNVISCGYVICAYLDVKINPQSKPQYNGNVNIPITEALLNISLISTRNVSNTLSNSPNQPMRTEINHNGCCILL